MGRESQLDPAFVTTGDDQRAFTRGQSRVLIPDALDLFDLNVNANLAIVIVSDVERGAFESVAS